MLGIFNVRASQMLRAIAHGDCTKTVRIWSENQSSGAVWKSRWTSWAPVPNKPTVSMDVKQHFSNNLKPARGVGMWGKCVCECVVGGGGGGWERETTDIQLQIASFYTISDFCASLGNRTCVKTTTTTTNKICRDGFPSSSSTSSSPPPPPAHHCRRRCGHYWLTYIPSLADGLVFQPSLRHGVNVKVVAPLTGILVQESQVQAVEHHCNGKRQNPS